MITHHPFNSLGGADHGWLEARHHFSFAGYHDPGKMSHGELLVINDDRIAPGTGFAPHSHDNMEIITFVREGAITHEDNAGNKGRTGAGNVQVMSAGTGITHSEYNFEDTTTILYQIWILPKSRGIAPRWDMAEFPKTSATDRLTLLVDGGHDGAPLSVNQDARIFAGLLEAGHTITHKITGKAYVLVSRGNAEIAGHKAGMGDGFAISDEDAITLSATNDSEAEILIIEVPGLRKAR